MRMPKQTKRLPCRRRLRINLLWNEQPAICLRKSCDYGTVGSLLLRLGLFHLKRRKIQSVLLVEDGLPCDEFA